MRKGQQWRLRRSEVAEEACSSSFQFHRIFTALCGISLGEYIRNRRLSRAAEILANSDAKVVDVAFRFCYETPESFTRAFTRFHGITPMEAKRGGSVKSFSKLAVKLVLTGGSSMDYRDGSFLQNIILIFFEKLRIIIHCLIKIFNGICFTEIVFVCIPLLSLHKVYLHGQCVKAPSHKDICRILLHLKNSWNQKLWRFPELFL